MTSTWQYLEFAYHMSTDVGTVTHEVLIPNLLASRIPIPMQIDAIIQYLFKLETWAVSHGVVPAVSKQ